MCISTTSTLLNLFYAAERRPRHLDGARVGGNQSGRGFGSFRLLFGNSGHNLPYHLPVRDCRAALGIRRCYRGFVASREVLPASVGYRWTRLYAWGVIPTISLKA